jgi:hypothetical protein
LRTRRRRWRECGLIAVGTGKFVRLRIAEAVKMRSRACKAVAAVDDAAGTRQMMLVLVEAGAGVGRVKVAGRQEVLQLPLCSFWLSRRLSSRLAGAGGCGQSRARVCLPGLLLSHKPQSSKRSQSTLGRQDSGTYLEDKRLTPVAPGQEVIVEATNSGVAAQAAPASK